jgi:hypothetical protein
LFLWLNQEKIIKPFFLDDQSSQDLHDLLPRGAPDAAAAAYPVASGETVSVTLTYQV